MGVTLYVTFPCWLQHSLLIFNLCPFNYSVSWCDPLWVDSLWDCLCFLDGMSASIPRLGEFSAIMSSNMLSASFFLPASSGTPIIMTFPLMSLTVFLGGFILSYGEGNGTPLQYSCLEIPWMEEPGGLQSLGSLRVGHNWATSLSLFTFRHWRRKWQPTPVFLPGESQGQRSLMGCRLWGRTESDTTEAT